MYFNFSTACTLQYSKVSFLELEAKLLRFEKSLLKLRFAIGLIFLISPLLLFANTQKINIACSSNFYGTLTILIKAYKKEGHAIDFNVMQGSSSKLVSQIMNGMPVDLFLSADEKYAEYVAKQKKSDKPFTYAIGQVVLLINNNNKHHYTSAKDYLEKTDFTHLSLASPKLAPYGAQAEALLKEMNLWKKLVPKMVYGDDIGQAFNYVITGNVDAGLVALSQVKQYEMLKSGTFFVNAVTRSSSTGKIVSVDKNVYYFDSSLRYLKQDGIVLKNTKKLAETNAFVQYILTSTKAKHILEQMGYQSSTRLTSKLATAREMGGDSERRSKIWKEVY